MCFGFIKTFLTSKLLVSESYKTAQNQNLCGKRGKLSQHYTGTIPSLLQKEIGHQGGEAYGKVLTSADQSDVKVPTWNLNYAYYIRTFFIAMLWLGNVDIWLFLS